ncbi:Cadmium-induced protein AS8 [Striga hermonthica]|uniref:Cadmium-induced protein AS8 n=1 Tax=Striga hermonthica TaxID=68872 RepID=A0A9N7RBJ3_STRHE|nr:Cadmium-induced protein AS8 [Striga hermonthica]
MIIKNIFGRYERWNPVHPTRGAFWGIGLGLGCGIGWGPGFGPEVIGYVGAGCGVGFNVGITLLGIGVGLPANYLFTVPHNVFMVTRRGVLGIAQAGLGSRSIEGDGWDKNIWQVSDLPHNLRASFSGFKIDGLRENMRDLSDVRTMLISNVEQITGCLQRAGRRLFDTDKDTKS